MSRSNLKTTRELRAAESMQFRKSILKGGGSVSEQERLNQLASDNNDQYLERLNSLNKFKKLSKKTQVVKSQKFEWQKEVEHLNKNIMNVENDLQRMIEILVVGTANEGLFTDIVANEILPMHENRLNQQNELSTHMSDMKFMLSEYHKSEAKKEKEKRRKMRGIQQKTRFDCDNEGSGDVHVEHVEHVGEDAASPCIVVESGSGEMNSNANANTNSNTYHIAPSIASSLNENQEVKDIHLVNESANDNGAAGIIADMLLQLRNAQESSWNVMLQEEKLISEELDVLRKQILLDMRGSSRDRATYELRHGLIVLPSDDPETELFIEETMQKVNSIIETHDKMLEVINEQIRSLNNKFAAHAPNPNSNPNSSGTGTDAGCIEDEKSIQSDLRYGGWSVEDHKLFIKIHKRAETAGTSRKKIVEQYKTVLQHIPYEYVDSHEEWYRAVKVLMSKKQELGAIHDATLLDAVSVAKSDVEAFRANRVEVRKNEEDLLVFEDRRQNIHLILAQQRAEKDMRDALKAQELGVLEAELREQREEALRLAREKAAEVKSQVEAFKQQRAAVLAEKERIAKEVENAKAEALKVQIEANKDKVEHRGELIKQKEEQRKIKEIELQQAEVKRLELLAKIAEQCPYWEGLQNTQSRLDHVTVAAQASMYIQGDEYTRGHIPLFGFSDKNIVKDARFKLISALRNAGVQNSEHAMRAIAQINPRPHLAIHGLL